MNLFLTKRGVRLVSAALALTLGGFATNAGGSPEHVKKELLSRYRKKFVVVLREGLAVGICSSRSGPAGNYGGIAFAFPYLSITVTGNEAKFKLFGLTDPTCGTVIEEPVHKGEVLKITKASLHDERLSLEVETVNPHSIQRGVGAFAHESLENGTAAINFFIAESGKDSESVTPTPDAWLKPFDTAQDASKFGNTASGVFVKEIKLGMTFAEVEQVLGPPRMKIDLSGKVLYKYTDMTVEFRGGRVTDVR